MFFKILTYLLELEFAASNYFEHFVGLPEASHSTSLSNFCWFEAAGARVSITKLIERSDWLVAMWELHQFELVPAVKEPHCLRVWLFVILVNGL